MPDYGLFLKYKFNDANGIFLPNKKPRRPDCRFWDQVIETPPVGSGNFFTLTNRMVQDPTNPAGPLIPVSSRVNADTKTMELVARTHPPIAPNPLTDRVYFAVKFDGGGGAPPVLNSITFSCGLNPGISFNTSTVASPFRDGTEIQCLLTGRPAYTRITSTDPFNAATVDVYDAIGPYHLIKDPTPDPGKSCFFKLTVVASASRGATNREFSYDPDMDIEMGL
jgi:hypothetical protein